MPARWKIFLFLNFLLSIPALIGLIVSLSNLVNHFKRYSDYSPIFLFLGGLLLITLNGLLNIFLLQRYFPDKLIPVSVRKLAMLSLVLNIAVAIGVLLLCIYGAKEEFNNDYAERDNIGKIALVIIFFLWLVQVVILIMQARLPAVINRNNREKMDSLIDSIGQ